MITHKTMRKAMVVAAGAGVALALQGAPAANAAVDVSTKVNSCKKIINEENASDLSPSTRRAWAGFICGGGRVTGGAARMVSGAWVGSPAIIFSATGQELTADQRKAWTDWNEGGHNVGRGAALIVSSVYVGAPGYIMDQIEGGATPTDLSAKELRQVSFAMPADSPMAPKVLPKLPGLPGLPLLSLLTNLLPTP